MRLRTGTQPVAPHGLPRGRRLPVALAILLTALLSLALPALAAGPASAATGKGKIYVIHGIVGQTLDIYVDGKEVKPDAKPKTIVGPLSLNAGSHQVSLRSGARTVASAKFKVGSGQSLDVIAHLRSDSSMGATVTAYRNDLSPVAPGKLRLVVAHVAAAPPADIRVNGDVLFSNVANGEALTEVVPSGSYKVGIVPAGTNGKAILGPVTLPLKKGTLTRVFAIGNVTTGSMDAIVHSLPVKVSGAAAPRSVPTGNGGQAATEFVSDSRSVVTEVMMGSAIFLLAAAGVVGLAGRRMRKRAAL
jgi:Domain of unknown function (DUF4397)